MIQSVVISSTETILAPNKTTAEKILMKSKAYSVYNIVVTLTNGNVVTVARRYSEFTELDAKVS
jgi:hypothetical protein